jgi:pimeloyl-ACP methyl ester carboxylesterase
MNDAAWLDTSLFATRPWPEVEAAGLASRPGMQMVRTPQCRMRVRAQMVPGTPAIIVLPDGPNTIEQHDPVFERFSGQLSVVAIETPGLGFSVAQHPAALGFDGTVAAVVEVIRALKLGKIIVTGSCGNAYVAIAVAAALPEVTLGVVASQATDLAGQRRWVASAIDPQGFLRVPVVGQLAWAKPEVRTRMSVDHWYRLASASTTDVEPWKATARWTIQCGACYALASLLQMLMAEPGISIPIWQGPAVILFGLDDKTHVDARSDPRGLSAYLPNAAVRTLPSAGHFPELEALPEFAQAIVEMATKAA